MLFYRKFLETQPFRILDLERDGEGSYSRQSPVQRWRGFLQWLVASSEMGR
ncbi:hypothetical protein CKA32_000895 [Geitlerinema sp. FC II]|nr:hypothetical protein CKA32_000895 [Geitlerinema sp. FC II]